jgi:hypothetical protein
VPSRLSGWTARAAAGVRGLDSGRRRDGLGGAGGELVTAVSAGVPEFGQCFLRALIERILTDRLASGDRAHDWQAPYHPAVRTARDIAAAEAGAR